ncbi:MAG TPA: rhodanese-like domain-containing protein [Ktedonobacterales bacterium]
MQNQRPDAAANPVPEITVREAFTRMSEPHPTPALVDVRETWEFQEGHAKDATNIPLSELRQRAGEVPRDREVLLICHSGQRSMRAAQFLRTQGVTHVANVLGGTAEWEAAGLPMIWGAR